VANDQLDEREFVFVNVDDDPTLSFTFDLATNSVVDNGEAPQCTVKTTRESYTRLMKGTSTFEHEVDNNQMSISGDVSLLRKIGKAFRAQQSS
jgi:hypothetical protein